MEDIPVPKGRKLPKKLPPLSSELPATEEEIGNDHSKRHRRKKFTDGEENPSDAGGTPRKPSKKKKTTAGDDNNEGPDQTKPKKKKKPVGSSREPLVSASEAEAMTDRTDRTHKKKKKKKKTTEEGDADGGTDSGHMNEVGLAAELGDLNDDIVEDKDGDDLDQETGKATQMPQWSVTGPQMRSEPSSKVFIEKQSGFKTKDKMRVARKRAEEQAVIETTPEVPPAYNTMQVALGSHRIFKTGTLFLQGLFAGVALWHIIAVWTMCNNSFDSFLENYAKLALPVSCIYYLLFAVICVSVFDRYDIGHPTRRLFKRCCTMQSGMIACLIYFTGLVFSLGITHIDDRIGMNDMAEWDNSIEIRDKEINRWLILNLMRGLMAIFGWFVISLRPNTDRLTKTLGTEDELFFKQVNDNLVDNDLDDMPNGAV